MKTALCGWSLFLVVAVGAAFAQADVNTTPSRATLDEASRASCDGVSVVVQRCAAQPDDAASKPTDALTKSRAATKAAFDRRDSRGRAAALKGETPDADTPVGDAQRLGGVTVTGKSAEAPLSVEQVMQRALNPNIDGVLSADGKTITHYGLDGSRYDCVAKCVGPFCCTEIRALPNPARDSNSIGR
jgi:hypothetical protein